MHHTCNTRLPLFHQPSNTILPLVEEMQKLKAKVNRQEHEIKAILCRFAELQFQRNDDDELQSQKNDDDQRSTATCKTCLGPPVDCQTESGAFQRQIHQLYNTIFLLVEEM